MIARVMHNNNFYGYVVHDTASLQTRVFSYQHIQSALGRGVYIENLTINDKGQVEITSGKASRYSMLDENMNLLNNVAYILCDRIKTDTETLYRMVDCFGNKAVISSKNLANLEGLEIANAKIVKQSNGSCYMARLSGSEGYELPDNERIRGIHTRKYQIPKINKDTRFRPWATYANPKEFRNAIRRNWTYFEQDGITVSNRVGILGAHGTPCHEDLCIHTSVTSRVDVSILSVQYRNRTMFLIGTGNWFMVDDILYIGKSWLSAVRGEENGMMGVDISDTNIVALGQVGILHITVVEEQSNHNFNNKDYSTQLKVYPYHRFTSTVDIANLLNQLTDANLGTEENVRLVVNQIKTGLFKYKLVKSVDIMDNTCSDSNVCRESNSEQSIISWKSNNVISSETIIHNTMGLGKTLGYTLGNEIMQMKFKLNEVLISPSIAGTVVARPQNGNGIVYNRQQHLAVDSYDNTRIDDIALCILSELGKIGNIPSSLVASEAYKKLKANIAGLKIDDNVMTLYIGTVVLKFSIAGLIERYNREMQRIQSVHRDKASSQLKLSILGNDIKLDESGYLIEWSSGTHITQLKGITGIRLTDSNVDKDIDIDITGRFDVVTRTTYWHYVNNIRLIYKTGKIINLLNEVNENTGVITSRLVKRVVDCTDITLPELIQTLSLNARYWRSNRVYVEEESFRVEPNNFKFNIYALVKNGLVLYNIMDNPFGQTKVLAGKDMVEFINTEAIPQGYIDEIMDGCFKSIPYTARKKVIALFFLICAMLKPIATEREVRDAALKFGLSIPNAY